MPSWPTTPDNYNAAAREAQELAASLGGVRSDALESAKVKTRLHATADRLIALAGWLKTTYPLA